MKKALYILFGILLSIGILLTAVEIVVFNTNHYMTEYEKHGITSVTGMDEENLQHVTEELLSYLKDTRDDLEIKAVVKGEVREVFGEREKLHMVDVKDLFINGRWIRNISIVLLGVLLILLIKIDNLWKKGIAKTLMYSAMANIDLLIILFLLMYFDFTKYFDYFHYIFFDNDLWILDPNKEILIQMLPERFFYNTAVKIAIIHITAIVTLGVGGFWYDKKRKAL
ncbi:integral membrane protein TIGR01906 [Natronincola peptidivorans]|uniref:Integral membrane protein TIGR01906 n=1 Tax=Natronincola peptidivorans TaxID=426128 RepID=A0A1I0A7X0_9FIRM|nr:TIGR01906 family membrane protein [Natronincola peptidivorans]SES90078.1 integral membrane protein TIGR01906 [Natronincola peptidivorans]